MDVKCECCGQSVLEDRRERFAAASLSTLAADHQWEPIDIARRALEIADALIAELEKEKG